MALDAFYLIFSDFLVQWCQSLFRNLGFYHGQNVTQWVMQQADFLIAGTKDWVKASHPTENNDFSVH